MKIALFLPNWIGDAVMATPALRALRTRFARAEMVAVLRPYVADVIAGLDLVDRSIVHNPRGRSRDDRGWRFVRQLKREQFDVAVLFPNSLRTAFIAWCSGAKRRVGFARDGRRHLLTDPLEPMLRAVPNPVLDEYLRLAERLGCDISDHRTEACVLPHDDRELARFWKQFDPRFTADGVICLNPGGAFGSSKHWPTENFADLARRIVDHLGRTVLVLCGPAERDEARQIVHQAGAAASRQFCRLSDEHWSHQGGGSRCGIACDNRLRAAAFRTTVRYPCCHALWPDPPGLERHQRCARRPSAGQSRLRPLSAPEMSVETSPLYARFVERLGLRRDCPAALAAPQTPGRLTDLNIRRGITCGSHW